MSKRHPVVAVTGSSGAGTSTVKRAFEHIFAREDIVPAVVEGDSYHRFERMPMKKAMAEALSKGENVEIRGFGIYKVVRRKARIGRNPKNSQPVQIPEKNAIRWKMSKTFFNRLNKSFTEDKISDTY